MRLAMVRVIVDVNVTRTRRKRAEACMDLALEHVPLDSDFRACHVSQTEDGTAAGLQWVSRN